ncbi:hypothetical protein CLU79DRAFT_727437 [Phycomyces nitens]|nr:hypothetical protein CLU79DRAFT_727437 [Phycomyces nitens]
MSQRHSKRQGTESKIELLKVLKDARLNRTRAVQYKNKSEDIYEEVDEDYDTIFNDENFVEDDDNGGYIDNGFNDDQMFSDEYEQQDPMGKRKRKDKKKVEPKKKEVTTKPTQVINRFFQKSATTENRKPKPVVPDASNEDFMADLLSSLGDEPVPPKKPVSHSHPRLSRLTQEKPRRLVKQWDDVVEIKEEKKEKEKDEPEPPKPTPKAEPDNFGYDAELDMDFGMDMDMDMDMMDTNLDESLDSAKANKNITPVESLPASKQTVNPKHIPIKLEGPRPDLQNWEMAESKVMLGNTATDIVKNENSKSVMEEDGSLRVWWYDVYERREKGDIYLFGKVLEKTTNSYISCCVNVKNIERNVFVLPRESQFNDQNQPTDTPVTMDDVYTEFSDICDHFKITKWGSKECKRKYAFEIPDVPAEAEYLKVVYGYDQPTLPTELSGKTFSRIFGANTGPLEQFLMKRDIMGPCWLEIKGAKLSDANESWCKIEIVVDNPKTCNPLRDAHGNEPLHIPPLVVMSLSLRTLINHQKNVNEIIAASAHVCTQVKIDEPTPVDKQERMRFTVVRQLGNKPYPAGFNDIVAKEKQHNGFSVQVERTEFSLLNYLIAKIHVCDPDVIVGHNFAGFDLDVLLHRMKALRTQNWHRLGRLKRRNWPKLQNGPGGSGESTYQERMIMSGRLVCDTYLAAKDLIRSKSYRMTDLAQSQLKIEREDIKFDQMEGYYEQSGSLIHFLKHCTFDAYLAMALMFKLQILPLTRQLTNLAGNLWARTMTGARAERNEFLLMHEFHRQKFICPDKTFGGKQQTAIIEALEHNQDGDTEVVHTKKSKSKRKPAYSGGLVLEPKKGFYDKFVLLLDFNSLYPSIIQEYNVCFTTVKRHNAAVLEEDQVPEVPDSSMATGVLPRLIKTLVDRRGQVKRLMKDPKLTEAERMQYDIRQKALKLTANSMYGCLGFSHSRFYAKPLAMLITHKGREILQNTVDLATSLDLNVIYGDTDSIMVYTNQDNIAQVKEIGNLLKQRVNDLYKLLEIDIDGMFKHMLLLKKKKYAALLVEEKPNGELVETIETKGLDLVRRDWCDLSHDVSSHILNSILSDKDREDVIEDIHTYLRDVGERIRRGEMTITKYIINKQLTKNPEEYADAKSQPHVQVAMRMRKAGQAVRAGDTVPYVICQVADVPNGTKAGFAERAYHPDDVISGSMQLDIEWYLNQQVFPPIVRLCSPIEGTTPGLLAECLGLDPTKYNIGSRTNSNGQDEEFETLESQISDEERFKDSEKLTLKCPHCKETTVCPSVITQLAEDVGTWSLECQGCQQEFHKNIILNQMVAAIRSYIRKYYQGWLICDDATCGNRTRMMSVFGRRCLNGGCRGLMMREYSDKSLYTQLLYFTYIFDPIKIINKAADTPLARLTESIVKEHQDTLTDLKTEAERYLNQSSYRHVDLSKLMAGIKLYRADQ